MAASTALGAAGAVAAVRTQDDAHRALLAARAQIRLDQAAARRDDLRASVDEIASLVAGGFASEADVARARGELVRAEGAVERARLDAREIELSGRAPRDDVGAPLVAAEDFVSARLESDLAVAASERDLRASAHDLVATLFEAGAAPSREVEEARALLRHAETRLDSVARRLALRRLFLDGAMTAVRAELEAIALAAETERRDAEIERQAAQQVHDEAAVLVQNGSTSRSELRAALTRLRTAEGRFRIAEIELRIARERIAAEGEGR
jgi:hypothetical protein